MKRSLPPALLLTLFLTAPMPALAETTRHDYPTMDRFQWIQECIARQESDDFVTVNACGCAIDVIAEHLPHDVFIAADTAEKARALAGDTGAYLREPGQSIRELRALYGQAKHEADKQCFVRPNRLRYIWPEF